MAYLQGSFSSTESCDRCFTRSKAPVGPPSEKCTPNDRFLCGNVPPRFPVIVSVIMLLFSFWSSSSASLSSRWLGNEPQNLYLWRKHRTLCIFRNNWSQNWTNEIVSFEISLQFRIIRLRVVQTFQYLNEQSILLRINCSSLGWYIWFENFYLHCNTDTEDYYK